MKRVFFVLVVMGIISACGYIGNVATAAPTETFAPTMAATATVKPVPPSPTPSPTLVPTPTATPVPQPVYYIVQKGDTLGAIAEKFGVPLDYLTTQNGLENYPNYVFAGEALVISVLPEELSKEALTVKKIVVNLTEQKLYFYEDGVLTRTMLVSTGRATHPTPPGTWYIGEKLVSGLMTDHATYYLPKVPWIMYMNSPDNGLTVGDGYSLHGTYWHHNFGHVMSHGCVNLSIPDAKWIYDRVEVGQEVDIVP